MTPPASPDCHTKQSNQQQSKEDSCKTPEEVSTVSPAPSVSPTAPTVDSISCSSPELEEVIQAPTNPVTVESNGPSPTPETFPLPLPPTPTEVKVSPF